MHTIFKTVFIFLLFQGVSLFSEDKVVNKIRKGIPDWMEAQISHDLSCFSEKSISLKKLNNFFEERALDLYLVKFTIYNNTVSFKKKFAHGWVDYRVEIIKNALNRLCATISLPNMVFLMSMHDGLGSGEDIP